MKSAKLFRGKLRTTPKYVSFIFFSPSLDDIKTIVYLQEKKPARWSCVRD
jgi:hypothetical protein